MSTLTPIYEPLLDASQRQIRLLALQPSSSFEAPLHGILHHVSLNDTPAPHYEALSYVWGEPLFDHEIVISGQPLAITQHLSDALRHLRPSDAPRMLWVDAICINQVDLAERSSQVTLMRDIFSSCVGDIAWMSAMSAFSYSWDIDAQTLGDAMALFNRIASKDAATLKSLNIGRNDTEPCYVLRYSDYGLLRALFSLHPLWSRVWIVQELACAPKVQLMCVRGSVDWETIQSFLGSTSYASAFHGPFDHGQSNDLVAVFGSVKRIEQQRAVLRQSGRSIPTTGDENVSDPDVGAATQPKDDTLSEVETSGTFPEHSLFVAEPVRGASSLLDVLARFRHTRATDPRDMAYGLLGLVSSTHSLAVDYTLPVGEVYSAATTAIIHSRGDLDILCQSPWERVRRSEDPDAVQPQDVAAIAEGLPSWVVNLASGSRDYASSDGLLFAQRGIFAAGRPACEVPCRLEFGGRGLVTRGAVIGRMAPVRVMGQMEEWQLGSEEHVLEIAQTYGLATVSEMDEQAVYAATGEPVFSAWVRTLLMDCTAYLIVRLTREEIDYNVGIVREVLADMQKDHDDDDPLVTDGAEETSEPVFPDPGPSLDLLESRTMLQRVLSNWNFFFADSGRGTGQEREQKAREQEHKEEEKSGVQDEEQRLFVMARRWAEEGDVLAVLDGAKVPVLLRPVEYEGRKCFQFVGPAYVHGFMDGEAVRLMEGGGLVEEEIVLV